MKPIGAFVYQVSLSEYKMSIRSHTKDIDVGLICGIFGGGGHKSAGAFVGSYDFLFKDIVISQISLYKTLKDLKYL